MSVLAIDIQARLISAYAGSKKAEGEYISKEIARHMGEAGYGIDVFVEMLDAYRNNAKTGYCPEWRELKAYLPRKRQGTEPVSVWGLTLDPDHFAALSEAYLDANWDRIGELMTAFSRYYPDTAHLSDQHAATAPVVAAEIAERKAHWAEWSGSGPRLKCAAPVPMPGEGVDRLYGREAMTP